jgi:hypothetical protein
VRYTRTLSDAGMIVTLILAFADYRRWHDIGLKVATMSRPRNGGRTPPLPDVVSTPTATNLHLLPPRRRAGCGLLGVLVALTNRGVYAIGFDRRATGWRTVIVKGQT